MVQSSEETFRLGIWSVKPENSAEFISCWQVSTDWLADELGDEEQVVLLVDREDQNMYISFASVPDLKKVENAMAQTEFQELWAEVMKYFDDAKPHASGVVCALGRR